MAETLDDVLKRYENLPLQKIAPKTNKHSRQRGQVWRFFKITDHVSDIGVPKYSCIFCSFVLVASPYRFKEHIGKLCVEIPAEIRTAFINAGLAANDLRFATPVPMVKQPTATKKRRIQKSRALYSDDEDMDEFDGDIESMEEKDKVVKILTSLIGTREQPFRAQQKAPLNVMSNEELDRELKELAVKKARLEVDALEEAKAESETRTYLMQKIGMGFDRLVTAAEILISEREVQPTITLDPSEVVEEQVMNGSV